MLTFAYFVQNITHNSSAGKITLLPDQLFYQGFY